MLSERTCSRFKGVHGLITPEVEVCLQEYNNP